MKTENDDNNKVIWLKNIFLLILGFLCVLIGVIGIFVPLLPTTPLLLLASILFTKSSPRIQKWLISNPILGSYLKNYKNGQISTKIKFRTITILWAGILFSIYTYADKWYVVALLLVVAISVTIHIIYINKLKK